MAPSPCVIHLCKNIGNHRFPKNEQRKAQWIAAIRTHLKPGLTVQTNSKICSSHFRRADFSLTPTFWTKFNRASKILKKTAVPSVFPRHQASQVQEQAFSSSRSLSIDQTEDELTQWNRDSHNPEHESSSESNFDYNQELHQSDQDFQDQEHESSSESIFDDTQEELNLSGQVFQDQQCESSSESIFDDTQEELHLLDQDVQNQEHESLPESPIFDHTKVKSTYSRPPQIKFIPLQPSVEVAMSDSEDPLRMSDETEFQMDEVDPNNQPEEYSMFNVQLSVERSDKQVQTEKNNTMLSFSIHNNQDDAKWIHFYTGLENYKKVMLVFHSLGKASHNLNYFYGNPPAEVDTLEQFFITLMILRRHKTFEEITMLYKITLKHVYSIFVTWIRFMSLQWKNLNLWIDKECIKAYMPLNFVDEYPATRAVLDATECPIKRPKLPLAQQVTFSSYKNKNTIKFIIGITPSGLISYVSPAYGGSATDRQIIERSHILDKFNYSDEIMVDKGLNVQDIFLPYGVKVNMPAFFKKGNQISTDTLKSNRKVASKRVHVERIIGMLKTYRILIEAMNQTETLLASDIVYICAMLVNFRQNIMNKKVK